MKAIIFLAVSIYLSQRYLRLWVARQDSTEFAWRYTEAVFGLALMLAFAFAIAAELMGLLA